MVKENIRRARYLAYNDGIHSNHQGLFLDFDFQALLGQVDTITPHANRRLKSKDPVTTEKYLEEQRKNFMRIIVSGFDKHVRLLLDMVSYLILLDLMD